MVAIIIYVVLVLVCAALGLRSGWLLWFSPAPGPPRPRGGSRRPPASPTTNQPGTSTTELTDRVAGYTSSSGEPGLESAVRETPRTLDALSRRIAPGCSTPVTGAHGASGQRPVVAVFADLDGRCFASICGERAVNITRYQEEWSETA